MASLRGGAIIPELCVYITLQYLAGGSYMDIFFFVGISQSSFFIYYGRQLMTEFRQPLQVQSHLEMPGILVQLGHTQRT